MERIHGLVLIGIVGMSMLAEKAEGQATNIALGKPTSQLSALDFAGFIWTAGKASDDCINTTKPEQSECCSASEGAGSNFWRLDLGRLYSVHNIVIHGRSDGTALNGFQLSNFNVFVVDSTSFEEQLYNNTGVKYGSGVFSIPLNGKMISSVIITRPSANILTLCEVQVFEALPNQVGSRVTYSPMLTLAVVAVKWLNR